MHNVCVGDVIIFLYVKFIIMLCFPLLHLSNLGSMGRVCAGIDRLVLRELELVLLRGLYWGAPYRAARAACSILLS